MSMNTGKIASYFAGPEVWWMLVYGMVLMLTSQNKPATPAGNEMLENIVAYVLIGAIVLSFLPLFWAGSDRAIWLARIGVSGLIGIYLISSELCESIRYNDSRDSGVGTLFILMIIFGCILLGLGLLGTALTYRFPAVMFPLLKWLAIGTGIVVLLILLANFIAMFSCK
jgi:hypothetical protein